MGTTGMKSAGAAKMAAAAKASPVASATTGHGAASGMPAAAAHGGAAPMHGMAMGAHTAAAKLSMGGMSMSAARGATNILPNWLAVIWTLVFIAVLVSHARHVLETTGERRGWHSGHVVMALGMIFMFAPVSLDHFNIPAGLWQLLFANAAGLVVAWVLARALSGRPVGVLWVLIAIDLAAMVYMWSPTGFVAPITWLLVVYFAVGALLWVTNRYRSLDGYTLITGYAANLDGTLTASVAASLVCERDLRASMSVMTFGMAYMFAAMQLLT